MATNFPTSLDDGTSLPNPGATDKTNSPSHASQHDTENDAIKAVETKLGTGSSTPTNNTLLRGNGTGTSTWGTLTSAQLAATISDETGSGSSVFGNTPTLITPKIDTITESTPGNGVTVAGVSLNSSKVNGSFITDSSVSSTQMVAGAVVQVVNTVTGAVATGTTTIPSDDTIPQNTEGNQFMSLSITPKSASNVLVIEVVAMLATALVNGMMMALFQDSTVNAIAAGKQRESTTGAMMSCTLVHKMTAGTTSSTTFKFRAGPQAADTMTFNGEGGSRIFGGVCASSITIWEYKA